MRLWSSMVLGGALALACGGSDESIFGGSPGDASAGTGAAGGNAGSSGANGSSGRGGSGGSGGSSGGVSDAPADGGSTSTDSSDDSPSDAGDAAGGSAGRTDASGDAGGGVGIGGPGEVVCINGTVCDLNNAQCCFGFPIIGCQPLFPPVGIACLQINCDDAADCRSNQTCCATISGGGDLIGANCATSCDNGTVLCNDSTRCPTGTTCKPMARVDNYRACLPAG